MKKQLFSLSFINEFTNFIKNNEYLNINSDTEIFEEKFSEITSGKYFQKCFRNNPFQGQNYYSGYYHLSMVYASIIFKITGKILIEDIPFGDEDDKFCLRMNSLTEEEYILLKLNNIRIHENLLMKQENKEDEVEYE